MFLLGPTLSTRLSGLFSNCARDGFTTSLSPTFPMRTQPIGPFQFKSDPYKANEAKECFSLTCKFNRTKNGLFCYLCWCKQHPDCLVHRTTTNCKWFEFRSRNPTRRAVEWSDQSYARRVSHSWTHPSPYACSWSVFCPQLTLCANNRPRKMKEREQKTINELCIEYWSKNYCEWEKRGWLRFALVYNGHENIRFVETTSGTRIGQTSQVFVVQLDGARVELDLQVIAPSKCARVNGWVDFSQEIRSFCQLLPNARFSC